MDPFVRRAVLRALCCALFPLWASCAAVSKVQNESPRRYPRAVASMEEMDLGGVKQAVLIRGEDDRNPVLLFLHGGPGYSEIPYIRVFQQKLERNFTVVQWDQRGTGKSYSPYIPRNSMTVDQLVSDARELVETLRRRFHQDKIYLVGHSWGTLLGVRLVQDDPQYFKAYVGIGQVVDVARGETLSFEYTQDQARKSGNAEALRELASIGRPPAYGYSLENINVERKWLSAFGGSFYAPASDEACSKSYLSSPEYRSVNAAQIERGIDLSMETLGPQILDVDLFKQAPELKVPVYFFEGRRDYTTPFELVERYARFLKAPRKELVWFERSGHHPHLEEPDRFQELMVTKVLAETR